MLLRRIWLMLGLVWVPLCTTHDAKQTEAIFMFPPPNTPNTVGASIMGVVEVDGGVFISFNERQGKGKGRIKKLDLQGNDLGVSASLKAGESFGKGLIPHPGGVVTTVSTDKSTGMNVQAFDVHNLNILFEGQAHSSHGYDCVLVAPSSGDVLLSNYGYNATMMTVIDNQGQIKFANGGNESNVVRNCPILTLDESSIYYVAGSSEDSPSSGGVVVKVSIDSSPTRISSDSFSTHVTRGPVLDPQGSLFVSTVRPETIPPEYVIHKFDADTLAIVDSIVLSLSEDYGSDIANPILSPDDGRILYLLKEHAIIAVDVTTSMVLFVTKTEISAFDPPLLTTDGSLLIHNELLSGGGIRLLFINALNGALIKEIPLKEAETIIQMQINAASDRLYVVYWCSQDADSVAPQSQLVAFSVSGNQSSTSTAHKKMSWQLFLLELILYPTILMLTLAFQVRRMSNHTTGRRSSSNEYQVVTSKDMEMIELRERNLDAEYGDVDESNDEVVVNSS